MELIQKYFPDLNERQQEQFGIMLQLYPEWNEKINVISRKDIENLEERHILHSLAIARFINFKPGSAVLDFGTGGGFPGIPLAVMFPETQFLLVDRTGKKLKVAQAVAEACGLTNVRFQHGDVAEVKEKFDFVVSRAVMPLDALWKACGRNIDGGSPRRNRYAPGLVCLKGGDLEDEIAALRRPVADVPVTDFFSEPFFDTKVIVYVPYKAK